VPGRAADVVFDKMDTMFAEPRTIADAVHELRGSASIPP
jgi:hypothetical protein